METGLGVGERRNRGDGLRRGQKSVPLLVLQKRIDVGLNLARQRWLCWANAEQLL